jgi:ketosteroid isomerase-like protein
MKIASALTLLVMLAGCVSTSPPRLVPDARPDARTVVMTVETKFAKTLADRDFEAFATFLGDEAVFITGESTLRGKQQVLDSWAPFFDGPNAPFSWGPDTVEVLPSGTLALSSGPVRDPAGNVVGRFTSIWRREAPGVWRIVFDQGNQVCD